MKSLPHPAPTRGFTLIELLVVIAIIAILASILIPSVSSGLQSAKKAKARREINDIAGAVKAYFAEYGKMPIAADNGIGDFSSLDKPEMLSILQNQGPYAKTANPKSIAFLAVSITNDPWKHPYVIAIDGDFNDVISPHTAPAISLPLHAKVAVYSLGPNGRLNLTGKSDDITTWTGQ